MSPVCAATGVPFCAGQFYLGAYVATPIENRAELPNIEPTFATFGPRAKTGAVLAGTGQRSPRDGAARAEQRDTRACGAGRRSARARRWPARGGTRRLARGAAGASAALLTPDRTAAAEKAVPCGGATRVLRRQELPAEATEASPPALVSLNHPRTPAPPRPRASADSDDAPLLIVGRSRCLRRRSTGSLGSTATLCTIPENKSQGAVGEVDTER